jgi:peptidoglycan/LPS O-acetylase OafA/YrhL
MVALPGMLDWFAIGMGLAVLRAELEAGRATSGLPAALGRRPVACLLLSFAAFAVAVPMQRQDLVLPWYGLVPHAAIGLGSGLLVLAVIVPRSGRRDPWPIRALAHPAVAWVGLVSYGIYLWHLPVLDLIAPHLLPAARSGSLDEAALTWLVVVAGGVACAAASWYLIERPLQRLFASRGRGRTGLRKPGRMAGMDGAVHSTDDPLNSSGVAVDHLA